jgi:hypothetical protein
MSRIPLIVLCGALAAASAPARADVVMPGQPIGAIDVFYDRLSPDGAWIDDARLGRVFVPDRADFVPYREGRWRYTEAGLLWESAEPFGWATSHYGRWGFSQHLDRWVWVPDLTWGPAWVDWVQSDGDFGWAPMPPAPYVGSGLAAPATAWTFCSAARVLAKNLGRFREREPRAIALARLAHAIGRYAVIDGARVVIGPSPQRLADHGVAANPVAVDMVAAGRMSAVDARTAVERAEGDRAAFELRNERRVQADPTLRALEARRDHSPDRDEE